MAKKKQRAVPAKSPQPRSFSGVMRGCSQPMRTIAMAVRGLVYEVLPNADERFHGGQRPIAMYRTTADVCWIQPHREHCNVYFPRGTQLTDLDQVLQGTSERFKYARVRSLVDLEQLPLRAWLQESAALNEAAVGGGMNFEQVLDKLRTICLALPNTKETLTWGIPHFRVGEKIFCGCGQDQGRPRVGLKMSVYQSAVMMKLPGIAKAPYSRPGDGWVTIDPGVFDDWDEIERLLLGSYRLIAPKRTAALLDSPRPESAPPPRRNTAKGRVR